MPAGHETRDERVETGRATRAAVPRSAHAEWTASTDRIGPVAILEAQAASRVPELVPVRHGRMAVSPFAFYRGAAAIMAADLAPLPRTGLIVQLCGDAHLSNFGVFGTPERQLVFDVNDFDETLPGPFEWDVKRLVASFEIAGRARGFRGSDRRAITHAVARRYREQMRRSAAARVLDAWYDHLDADRIRELVRVERAEARAGSQQLRSTEAIIEKAHTRDDIRSLAKLARVVDGRLRIVADPPLIVPVEDLVDADSGFADDERTMRALLASYRATLPRERHPITEFEYVHLARKVVGVGSVGTRAWIILLRGRDDHDPLFLQAKEAQASVLEAHLGASEYQSHAERVVRGQRAMQAAGDIFLGWQRVAADDGVERDFMVRRLADWKGSIDTEHATVQGALLYARLCGETLARAHARTGDRVEIASYLGRSDRFDRAMSRFATRYADQNDRDYATFIRAIDRGGIRAIRDA
ncbi:DUF2252 domain-containing protein [Plantibacter sp. Mn2098]|uniref:DUF2252 domain-containing protein n=1 Tax=Plantibacter sp. Mn2098 TaxID=3395266 RepID=UPI003BEA6B84